MKVFLCFVAVLVVGASALPQSSVALDVDMSKIVSENVFSKVQQFQYIAKNFESWSTRKQIENINDFVDMIIAEVRSFLVKYGFDPMNIPDIDEEIEITGVPIHLKLNDGVIFNASSIYRDGDINLYYENRLLVVEVPIFFKVFKMDYEYDIAVSSDGSLLEGKLNGEVVLVDVNFAVQVDFKALQISLKSYSISNIGAINIDFEGSMLNWVLQGVTDYVTTQLKDEVIAVVEAVCSFTMTSIFDIINKVLEGLTP